VQAAYHPFPLVQIQFLIWKKKKKKKKWREKSRKEFSGFQSSTPHHTTPHHTQISFITIQLYL